jgi:hypothetical protein
MTVSTMLAVVDVSTKVAHVVTVKHFSYIIQVISIFMPPPLADMVVVFKTIHVVSLIVSYYDPGNVYSGRSSSK